MYPKIKSAKSPMRQSILLLLVFLLLTSIAPPEWGFYGHRRINRLAVFTLPPEMIVFYKKHIEYITEHAVDPDKRRYATRFEGPRHFIDIDHWGEYPFREVPRDWTDALAKYTHLFLVTPEADTLQIMGHPLSTYGETYLEFPVRGEKRKINTRDYRTFFRDYIQPQYYEDKWTVDCAQLAQVLGELPPCTEVYAVDEFSEYGISPYNLVRIQAALTRAFRAMDQDAILRLSAEIGHYIGDAHVPLHTTENYNGQLTNQVGIHAFWESRIPELFADKEFDNLVGPAEYIPNPSPFYWDVVLASHSHLDSVLLIEKELSLTFPRDQQYCYEERLGRTIRTECQDYARAYRQRMKGMVEERWRASIHTVGSAWYSAWVDAGQPDLSRIGLKGPSIAELERQKELDEAYISGDNKGRAHGGDIPR